MPDDKNRQEVPASQADDCACCSPQAAENGPPATEDAPALSDGPSGGVGTSTVTRHTEVVVGEGTSVLDVLVQGMCCADEARQVEAALGKLGGVRQAQAFVSAERATVTFDPSAVTPDQIREAVREAGFGVPESDENAPAGPDFGRVLGLGMLGVVAAVVVVATVGERLGLLDRALEWLPWWIPALAILLGGWPVFLGVVRSARQGKVTGHTLMTVGTVAAMAIGQWTTAALLVFFMRFADWVEELATSRSRQAVRQLVAIQPATARVLRDGREVAVPVAEVGAGEVVAVRPGERIPVDGEVVEGQAPVDQASITGESVPVDKAPGDPVFAATVAQAGYLKIRATKVGSDTTFARIIRLVEEAEAQKAPVQRFAERFAAYYLPAVLLIALGAYLVTGEVLNAVAALVVACACAIVMATPISVLASVGNGARRGILVKGGLTLEQLAKVDTVVMDKTGTLTLGKPQVTDVVALNSLSEAELLQAAAAVELRSEHPLGRAIIREAAGRGIEPLEPEAFTTLPGRGLVATVSGREWAVGNRQLLAERGIALGAEDEAVAAGLERAGKTAFFVADGSGTIEGVVGMADVVRPEARAALSELQRMGVRRLLLLTGDNERVAAAVAGELGLEYRAELLPDDKIEAVRQLQFEGAVVMMIGDGVNDAPALAQADVGVAMGAAGTDVAIEAADVALMRDDWSMVPEVIRLGRRASRTIRQNLGFTAVYNVVGITLAVVGILPPVWAAAAQSLPDIGVMLNSSRLLRAGGKAGLGSEPSERSADACQDDCCR